MRSKSFISVSEHETFFRLLEAVLTEKDKSTLDESIAELLKDKEELGKLFSKYKNTVAELHFLINKYHSRRTEIRKKIRKIQLSQNTNVKNKLINSVQTASFL